MEGLGNLQLILQPALRFPLAVDELQPAEVVDELLLHGPRGLQLAPAQGRPVAFGLQSLLLYGSTVYKQSDTSADRSQLRSRRHEGSSEVLLLSG